jgi:hypothetical protein
MANGAVALLVASASICVSGYVYGIFYARDSIDAEKFFVDFPYDSEGTTATATEGTVRAFRRNIRDRTVKRVFVTVALILRVAGTILVALARTAPNMVSSIHEASIR